MYGLINVMTARTLHLAMSWWSFILMGVHIGLHMKAMTAKLPNKGKTAFKAILTGISGVGLWLFLKSGIVDYITFRMHFAFLDYTTAKWLIILQNLAMLMFFVLAGYVLSEVTQKNKDKKYSVKPLVWLGTSILIGVVLNFALKESIADNSFDNSGWQVPQSTSAQTTAKQTEPVTTTMSVLLTAVWNADDRTFDALTAHYKTLVRYINFEDKGMVLGYGCGSPSMTRSSQYPEAAYRLGRSL